MPVLYVYRRERMLGVHCFLLIYIGRREASNLQTGKDETQLYMYTYKKKLELLGGPFTQIAMQRYTAVSS